MPQPHPIHGGRFGIAELDVAGFFVALFLTTDFFPVVLSLLEVLILAGLMTTDAFIIIGINKINRQPGLLGTLFSLFSLHN